MSAVLLLSLVVSSKIVLSSLKSIFSLLKISSASGNGSISGENN